MHHINSIKIEIKKFKQLMKVKNLPASEFSMLLSDIFRNKIMCCITIFKSNL